MAVDVPRRTGAPRPPVPPPREPTGTPAPGLVLPARGSDRLRVSPDDALIIQVRNALAGVVLTLGGRLWTLDEKSHALSLAMTPTSDRALNTFTMPLGDGWLDAIAVNVSTGSPLRGQTLVGCSIARPAPAAFAPKRVLAKDYVTPMVAVTWPGGRTVSGLDGPGALYSIAPTVPGPGVDWTQTVPTGARWLVQGVHSHLLNSATVANRGPRLIIDDGTTIQMSAYSGFTSPAGVSADWDWAAGQGNSAAVSNLISAAMAFPVYMLAGWRIRVATSALQAGDQWSAIRLSVMEWLED